ncbi:MAG: tRNA (N(6)-L-threonylcarbamoyladenosine(37)-C(2))-methylthiotransferase MtaB [candidate division Zixibacteria bacterium]|nr:tRNA (N(6)-L-threonylcarbamoyladenosine(37)-C(2))-methylthiotransferase MtaB [candidate division Zixibacteria bacterium]
MAKVALTTVGCRLNQYETEKIAVELTSMGLTQVNYNDMADLYILNTCTVTGRADADCRKLINRAYRKNPKAVMVVAGCYVVAEKETISEMNGVDLVVGNDSKMELPTIIKEQFQQLFLKPSDDDYHSSTVIPEDSNKQSLPRSRPMVQIGTGCNQNCSYCIVPKVRGELVSFDSTQIIEEINRLVQDGYHEVVLTAVHIGKYKENKLTLAGLVKLILKKTEIPRLRLSSLEPNELDDELLELVAGNNRVCRHLHLPLQSGSNTILRQMRRPYSREDFLAIIERIKTLNDNITVGCDIIVGFPGESEDDFSDSISVLNSGFIDYGHVFSYSDRPGTPASAMVEKISPATIKERSRIARTLCEANMKRRLEGQIGKAIGVISVGKVRGDGLYRAVSDNYLKVKLPQLTGGTRKIIKFMPEKVAGDCLSGIVLP